MACDPNTALSAFYRATLDARALGRALRRLVRFSDRTTDADRAAITQGLSAVWLVTDPELTPEIVARRCASVLGSGDHDVGHLLLWAEDLEAFADLHASAETLRGELRRVRMAARRTVEELDATLGDPAFDPALADVDGDQQMLLHAAARAVNALDVALGDVEEGEVARART